MGFIICSYNALHHYPRSAEAQHLVECPDRIALISSKCAAGMYRKLNFVIMRNSNLCFVIDENGSVICGNLSLPPPAHIQFEKEEGWDSD